MDFEQLVLSTDELNTLRVISQGPVDQTTEWTERVKTLYEKKLVETKNLSIQNADTRLCVSDHQRRSTLSTLYQSPRK